MAAAFERVLAVLVVLALVLIACQASPQPPITVEPSTSGTTPPSESSPAATGSTTPIVVTGTGIGTLRGNWIVVGKLVPGGVANRAQAEIWAVPLDGGPAKLALAYAVPTAGIGDFDNTPYLRRQFSPDGSRIVLAVEGELVIIDLSSARSHSLGVAGHFPSWSKDGTQIAFFHSLPLQGSVPPDVGLAVAPVAGGPIRDLAVAWSPRQSAEWSPDGSTLLLSQREGVAVIDVPSGQVQRRLATASPGSASFAHWRTASPQLVLGGYGCDQGNVKIVALDGRQSQERTILDGAETCTSANLRDPRWNPARPNEIVYVRTRQAPGLEASGHTAHILDTVSGRDENLGLAAYEATWTWDGGSIAYILKSPSAPYGNSLRVWSRTTSLSRELLSAGAGEYFFSVASVAY